MGDIRNAYTILVRNSQGKVTLGRARHRCGDNIEMNIKEIGCEWDSAGSR
jgi:hypothetical protein